MFFERKKYLDLLVKGQGNGMVKIVTGIRRSGKSFLLFEIFRRYLLGQGVSEDHIIGLSLDDLRNRSLRNPERLLSYVDKHIKHDNQKTFIILDEVQLVSDFVELLLTLMHMPNVEVYVSGSNSKFLSSDVVTEFRGRGDEIRVHPLSLSEYIEGTGKDYAEAVKHYFVYGGLPQVAIQDDFRKKENFLHEMAEVTYTRDLLDRNRIKNEDGLKELLRIAASGIGCSTNPKKIADTFKSGANIAITDSTIRQYLKHLEDAFILEEAMRYDIKGRKYIGAENKYYFEDIGIRNALLNFRQQEDTHIMENIIYNELRARGYSVDVGMVETWESDEDGERKHKKLEVDFVVNRGSERLYIQSAYALSSEDKVKQEIRPFRTIHDAFRRIVIVYEDILTRKDEAGIITMGLREFLTNALSIENV